MICERHHVRLQLVRVGNKKVWKCPYSHTRRFENLGPPLCRRCKKNDVHAEGLCYTCWYYSS